MTMKHRIVIFTLSLIALNPIFAQEYLRTIEIKQLHPIGNSRPSNPAMENSTRIYFKESANWSVHGCRDDAADLRGEDAHLLSILLMAWATDKEISLNVDNTIKPDGEVCQVTTLTVQ